MTSDDIIISEIPEIIDIPAQNLQLINEVKPYFMQSGDLYVIIAREINIRNGMNIGDLRVGIIRIPDSNHKDNFEVVLPFSKNLIYATIADAKVRLAYVENNSLKSKEIPLNSEGRLNHEDYAFLLDKEVDYSVSSHILQR